MKGKSHVVARIGFLLPGLALLTIFVLVPILLTAWMSLHRGSMINSYDEMTWVGLKNYQTIFQQSTFTTSLINVILYSLANLVLILPLAILLGMFHGYADGSAIKDAGRFAGVLELIGLMVSLFVLTALLSAMVVSLRWDWTKIVVRVAGSWIAAMGLLILGWSLKTTGVI